MTKGRLTGILLGLCGFLGGLCAEEVLLPKGGKTIWRYLDDGSAPGGDWTSKAFDHSKWKRGKAPLGYGEKGLGTTIAFGANAKKKHLTSYFRTSFKLGAKEESEFAKIGIFLKRDDGAAVYLNGEHADHVGAAGDLAALEDGCPAQVREGCDRGLQAQVEAPGGEIQ